MLEGVTTPEKVLDEYITMILFVLLPKRVHFLSSETKDITTQMKSFDEYTIPCVSTEEISLFAFFCVDGTRLLFRYREWLSYGEDSISDRST